MLDLDQIKQNLSNVRRQIAEAAVRVGRSPDAVNLVVVTKGHPVETIRMAIESGAQFLGESYADHAVPKIQAIGPTSVEWHMIGHVQSRKSRQVAEHFDLVHSLDGVKLARRLQNMITMDHQLSVFLQVNVSGEKQKFGIPAWDEPSVIQAAEIATQIQSLDKLRVCGLMTIPPFLPPDEVRPYFKRLVQVRDTLQDLVSGLVLPELSMGMSGDFEVAVEEGATFVRVGTAILGPRQ